MRQGTKKPQLAVSSAGRGSIPPVLGPVAAWKGYLPGREIQARAALDPGGRDQSAPSQDAASGCLKNSAGFNSRQYGSTGDERIVPRPELRFKEQGFGAGGIAPVSVLTRLAPGDKLRAW